MHKQSWTQQTFPDTAESTKFKHWQICCFVLDNLPDAHLGQNAFKILRKIPEAKSEHKKIQMNAYLTRTHSMQIFGEIPFIKPQNDT